MSSESLQASDRKKKTQHIAKRDQPLFASRRPGPSLQQAPEFLTESLNTTFIPSPSPVKASSRQHARPRPNSTSTRSPVAFRAPLPHQKLNKENERSRSPRQSPELHRKSSPLRNNTIAKSSLPVPISRSPVRTKTPSPPPSRGRQSSIESPANSELSPPHGYAEAYQRIVEEENLASEDSIDHLEVEELDNLQALLHPEIAKIRSRRQSRSPISLKVSRKSPGAPSEEDVTDISKLQGDEELETEDIASEPGHMEDATLESVSSGSSQYARDIHRLNSAIKGSGQAFSKTRVGARNKTTLESLRRRNGSSESLASDRSAVSFSNAGSDPSVNILKAWGRKAKPGKDWLSRITNHENPNDRENVKEKKLSKGSLSEGVEADDLLETASALPLPASSPLNTSSESVTPRSYIEAATSVRPKRDWEFYDDDFTGRSLQVSDSPPIQVRPSPQFRLRDQEIEKLEKRAVATSMLEQLRGKLSTDSLQLGTAPKKPEQKLPAVDHQLERARSWMMIARTPSKPEEDTGACPAEENAHQLPDTPVSIYPSKATDSLGEGEQKRPRYDAQESHDILKRLASVTSDSPTPPKSTSGGQATSTDEVNAPTQQNQTPIVTGAWIDQTLDPLPMKPQENPSKTPRVSGAWVDTPRPAAESTHMLDHKAASLGKETQANQNVQSTTKPPLVNGGEKKKPAVTSKEPSLVYTGPPLPKSTLQEIVHEAKLGKSLKIGQHSDSEEDQTLLLGNSTIQSLEDLVENDTNLSTAVAPTPSSQETSLPSSDSSPSSKLRSSKDQSEDPNAYKDLLSRLTNLGPSLRASKRQLVSLEQTLSTDNLGATRNVSKRLREDELNICNEAGEFHDFIWPCQRCGCPGGSNVDTQSPALLTIHDTISSSMMILSVPIPRLWTWARNDWRPRLTWLGIVVFSIYLYLFAETWAQ